MFPLAIEPQNVYFLVICLKNRHFCPHCGSSNTIKRGKENGIKHIVATIAQVDFATNAGWSRMTTSGSHMSFTNKRSANSRKAPDTTRKHSLHILMQLLFQKKEHRPRPIHLVVDATYFGKRMDDSAWGVVLFRDADEKENL